MKRFTLKRFTLNHETIRILRRADLHRAVGGLPRDSIDDICDTFETACCNTIGGAQCTGASQDIDRCGTTQD